MPGCGYICPKCNDSGFDENQQACDWCKTEKPNVTSTKVSEEDWIKSVHEGSCCGDLGQANTSAS